MAKNTTTTSNKPTGATLPPVTSYDEIQKMKPEQRIARFADRATVSQRAFAEMGKLYRSIEASLTPPKSIFSELQAAGVKKGTVSNASYAAKVFDLVIAGHVSETAYDTLTFQDCLAIVRVVGPQSKRRLTGDEVSQMIDLDPIDFADNLGSLYETGKTLAEREADDAARKKAEAQAEADRIAAQQKAEADRKAAEQERQQQQQQPPAAEASPTPAPAAETPTEAPEAETTPPAPEPSGDEPSKITAMPAEHAAPEPVQQPPVETPAPGASITPIPVPVPVAAPAPAATAAAPVAASTKPTPADGMELLDKLEAVLVELSNEDALPVIKRLCDLAEMAFGLTAEGKAQAEQKVA